MKQNVSALERAFELAQSGTCRSVSDIQKKLTWEGYSGEQLTGPLLRRQLLRLMEKAGGSELSRKGP